MSVIGIDFGNDNCYIAVARQGGIETIANDYSLRTTPSCVAFGERNRVLGVAAKNQQVTNIKNTVLSFKKLIGKSYRDHRVKDELVGLPYKVVELQNGSIGIVVRYINEERIFTPTQLTAMLFTKLKQTAEVALEIKVNDVVIGVPCTFDDAERRATLDAATAAGLNVLRLMNETTAVALAYGIYKQDLPAPEDKPRNVVFVDSGHSSLQVCAAAFNKGKLKMLAATSDSLIGGREFDKLLAGHFATEFKTRYKIDVKNNARAWIRLMTEVEKLKKQMSANSTELPLNIECLMDDKDVSGKLKREDLEGMCGNILMRVEQTLTRCLAASGLRVDDVHAVEIVGGSSRVPSVKMLIEKIFKKQPSTTLNQDEAVARGCALQCAILSPAFKVREFCVTDVQPFSIRLVWRDENGQQSDMEVFPKNHQVPFSKMLTFFRKEAFTLQGEYSSPSPSPDPIIGHFIVQNVIPNAEGESQKVKVKVRVNLHGLFTVASASLTEKKEMLEESPQENATMETEEKKEGMTNGPDSNGQEPASGQAPNDQNMEQETESKGDNSAEANTEQKTDSEKPAETADNTKVDGAEKKLKKVVKTIDLPISHSVKGLGPVDLNGIVEQEAQMVAGDKLENERINAKNAVEEYVYDTRGKLFDELQMYVAEHDRESISQLLGVTENWLYEDGEDCQKQVYVDKLAELMKRGEPIKERRRQFEELPLAFESYLSSIQQARKAHQMFMEGNEKYCHLDSAEMEKVVKSIKERQLWVDQHLGIVSSAPLTVDSTVTAFLIRSEKGTFDALCNPILNKPKPKPKVEEPPPPTSDKAPEPSKDNQSHEQQDVNNDQNPQNLKTSDRPTEPMDVD